MLHALMRVSICRLHSSTSVHAVNKSLLSKLRKKTGISFINCKKALEKFDNDLEKAEKWLKEQAEKEGWTKASKLESRPMSQGLVGLIVDNNCGAMLELNCETDFVARNIKFQRLVSAATNACLKHGKRTGESKKMLLDAERLKAVLSEDGKTLQEQVVLNIGNIGENMRLRRAIYVQTADSMKLGHYIHSAGAAIAKDGKCQFGKYGAFVMFEQSEPSEDQVSPALLGQQLAQHVVGMRPKTLGTMEDDTDDAGDDTKVKVNYSADGDDRPHSPSEEVSSAKDETSFLQQEFLLDEGIDVRDFLKMNSAVVEDFVRFECGEVLENNS